MRQIYEYAKMAYRNIMGSKMRSFLTMLGIIIGIGAVIMVLCIGGGGQRMMDSELGMLSSGSVYLSVTGEDTTVNDYFTDGDVEAVGRMEGVAGVTMAGGASGSVRGPKGEIGASLSAGNGSMFLVFPATLQAGRFWDASDYDAARRVVTVDSAGAKALFGTDDVLGMTVQLTVGGRTSDFTIIGITESQSGYSYNGKITAQQVQDYVEWHRNDESTEHIVQPGMVYISHPTEGGTLYTKAELTALYDTCRRYGLPLFIDGARLGYGLMAEESDMTLPEIARLCDVFYIGGTKVGALFGEAVVIMNENLKKDFRFIMKQRGGRMAKGRLLGVQFDTLFTDDLYFKISRHAIEMAHQIRDIFVSAGYPLLFDSPTNQQYPIMSDDELAILGKSFGYEYWERVDETHSGVRFCASWATKQEHVDALRTAVNALKK